MKDRYIAVVIILLIILFSVIGLALMAKKVAVTSSEARESQQVEERYMKFLENDVTLYWIGDYPAELERVSEKVVKCSEATRDNMPLKSPEFHTIRKDENGNVCYIIGLLKSIRTQLNKGDGDCVHVVILERE